MDIGFEYFARNAPLSPAIYEAGGRCWNRGEVLCLSNRIARGLRASGIVSGDVVALLIPNRAEFFAALFAALRSGLYVVPLNWHLTAEEIAYILGDSQTRALILDDRFAQLASSACAERRNEPPLIVSLGSASGFIPLDEFIRGCSAEPLQNSSAGHIMQYTSATSGRPKGVQVQPQDPHSVMEQRVRLHMSLGTQPDDGSIHLCGSMLYHSAPLELAATCLHMGHAVVLLERLDAAEILRLIDVHRVATAFMAPTMFVRLLKLPDDFRRRYDVSSLKWVNHAGSPCPPEIKRRMLEWLGPVVWEGYGCTEGGGGTVCSPQDWLRFPGTVGKPLPGAEVKIFDECGNPVPAGQPGLVYMTRFTGGRFEYRGDPGKTAACFREDGFFTVGDIGYLNEEGFLFICDRAADVILCGGTKIYSAEVEQVLVMHPAVTDCAVVGIPDDVLGEVGKAFLQLTPGYLPSRELTSSILQFAGQHLMGSKLPRRMEFVEALPRDPTGKLYKRRLRIDQATVVAARPGNVVDPPRANFPGYLGD